MGKLNLYRNISITFVVFAAMILCALFLTFYSQATIVITPDPQVVNLGFNVEVRTSSTDEELKKLDAIRGEVAVSEVQVTSTFDVLSTKSASGGSTNIVGRVKIINAGKSSQTLIKTTQLQDAGGTIVRTNNQVVVPAGGSVEVDVFPKDQATFKEVNPGKLVIIKLPAASQQVVYGEAENVLAIKTETGGDIKFLAESDVNRAKKELVEKAVAEAISASGSSNANILGEVASYALDRKLGDETEKFTMTAKIRLKTVKADLVQLSEVIKKRAQNVNQGSAVITSIDQSFIRYAITNTISNQSFNVKVSYPLTTALSGGSEVLAKDNFAGKTADEIKSYAEKTGAIKEVEVVISPYWRKTTPQDLDRIKVILK